MAKIDKIKELIGFLKAIFITLIIIDTSLIAWEFKNYLEVQNWKLYVVLFLIIVLSLAIAKLFLIILEKITSLEDVQ